MKIFLLCAIVVCGFISAQALTLSPEQKAKIKEHRKVCTAETNVDKSLIKKANDGKFTDDPVFKKYVFCCLKRANLVDNKGHLQEEVLMAKLPKDTNMLAAKVITELCKSQQGSDPADQAFQLYKCYYEATPQHVSLI